MGNFGNLTLKVYDQDLGAALATYTNVIAASGTAALNRAGNGECTVKVQATTTGLVEGNIAVCYISDTIGGGNLAVCTFTIEEIHWKTSPDGMSEIRMSGRDLLGELTGYKHFVDIGAEYPTTVAEAMTGPDETVAPAKIGDVETYAVTPSRSIGEYSVYVDDYSAFSVGDDIVIELNESGEENSHFSYITEKTAPNLITTAHPFSRGIRPDLGVWDPIVVIPEVFKGDSVLITMNGASGIHYTRVAADPGPYQIRLEEDLPTGEEVDVGNALVFVSGNLTSDTDVQQIMSLAVAAGGWVVDTTAAGNAQAGGAGGTSAGTGHRVDGANTLQLLINTNELTTEWFRLSAPATPDIVSRSIDWRASSDASGVLLTMPTAQATTNSDYLLTARGIMQSLTAESRWKIATAVVAKGGTDNFNLGDKTDADVGDYRTELVKGKWRVTNDAAAVADWVYVHYVTFDGVESRSDSPASIAAAANELYAQAMAYLAAHDSSEEFVQASGVVLHVDVLPGQGIATGYSETNWTDSRTVYIVERTHSVGSDGVRYTDLLCSETSPYNRETAESKILKVTSGGGATSIAGASGGGGGGTGETHDPVTVTSSSPAGSLTVTGQALSFLLTAGDGLAATGTTFDIDLATNSGLQLTSGELEMGTPSAVTATSSSSVTTTTHTHAVTATSDGDGTPSTILKASANGGIRLDRLGINTAEPAAAGIDLNGTLEFQGPESITTTSGDLTIAPAGDIFIDPAGDNMQFDTTVDPQGESYVAAGASAFTTQWKIDTGIGAGYFAYLEADQMHIRLFQADVTMAKANGMVVTDSVAVLSADFDVVAVSSTVEIAVDDNPALGGAQVFQDDDWVRMRVFERAAGLDLFDLWGQVDNYTDVGDGTQTWDMVVRYAGVGDGAVGLTVQAGGVVLGYGKSGQGWWEVDARRNEGPLTRIGTWAGANPYTASNRNINLMTGRLLSLTGNDEYGFYAGVSLDGPHMLITERTAEFQDIDISMLTGTPDGGYIRVYAIELNSDIETAIAPDGDVTGSEVVRSSGTGTWYSHINENPSSGQPDAQWIYNTASTSGYRLFSLEDITHTLTELSCEVYFSVHNFNDDTCQLRAQVVALAGSTPLTDEIKLGSESSTDASGDVFTVNFTGIVAAADAIWATALLKLSWVYFTVGSDEILTMGPEVGLDVVIEDSSDYSSGRAITLSDGAGTEVGGLYGRFSAGNNYYLRLGTNEANFANPMNFTDSSSIIAIESFSSINESAHVYIRAYEQASGGGSVESGSSIYLNAGTGGATPNQIETGSTTFLMSTNQFVVNQYTNDSNIIELKSEGDVIHGMTDFLSTDAFASFSKVGNTDGGLNIRGATDATMGVTISGLATTVDTTEATSSLGPVLLVGWKRSGTGLTAFAADDNIVVMRNGGTTRWILKGDGEVYSGYATAMTTFDAYDDVALVRAASLLSPQAIRSQFDDMVQYNRDDLEAAGLISGTMVNTTGFMRLHSGAIWQLHQRIAQLESELKAWKNDNRH